MTSPTIPELQARIADLEGALDGIVFEEEEGQVWVIINGVRIVGIIDDVESVKEILAMAKFSVAKQSALASDGSPIQAVVDAAKAYQKVAMPGPERLRLFEAIAALGETKDG